MVASHTAVPLGTAKWLVRATPPFYTLPLGKGHGLTMSPTQGQAILLGGLFLSSHFETPKGVSVWLATFVRCRWHHSFDIGHSIIIPFDNVLLLLCITNAHS